MNRLESMLGRLSPYVLMLGTCAALFGCTTPGQYRGMSQENSNERISAEALGALLTAPTIVIERKGSGTFVNGVPFKECAIPKRDDGYPDIASGRSSRGDLAPCESLVKQTVFSVGLYGCMPQGETQNGTSGTTTCTRAQEKVAGEPIVVLGTDGKTCVVIVTPITTYTVCYTRP